MKHVNENVDYMQVFVTISKGEMKINAGVNVKNWLTKVYAIRDLFRIQVILSVNVINHVINYLKNVLKNVEEVKLVKRTLTEHENKHKNEWSSSKIYVVLIAIIFYNQHWNWYLILLTTSTCIIGASKNVIHVQFGTVLKQQFNELINGKYQANQH